MTADTDGAAATAVGTGHERFLFMACFVALVATSFAFIIRVMAMGDWQVAFGLSETQKGEIFGAGFWPFGISIVLFSLVIDRVGYGRSMIFAFVCHVASTLILITAKGYWGLYLGSILNGLAAGTVEAVINPAVASLYPKAKTRMLTMLHAGWPGGMALGGLLIMALAGFGGVGWQVKVAVILIPVIAYGVMLLKCTFPVSERVAAGVSYKDMLKEAGALGALIVTFLIAKELGRIFALDAVVVYGLVAVCTVAYYIYTGSFGRPMYIFLLFVMILLAITELGTDAWIKELMTPAMAKLGMDAGWVLVYTSIIMTILRFCIGPIERRLKPLGVLLVSSLFAAAGLRFLSSAQGIMILLMATIYGTGQCFFWPVTLGLVAERFPRGGALTLNAIAGVGMLGVGILGGPLLGYWQDTSIDRELKNHAEVHAAYVAADAKESVFGSYQALDQKRVNQARDMVALYEYREKEAAALQTADPGALSAALADDKAYQTLVRTAYAHLEGSEKAETADFATMRQAVAAAGLIAEGTTVAKAKADMAVLDGVRTEAKRSAMARVAYLPLTMALCYLGLILYFHSKGGYQPVALDAGDAKEEDGPASPAAI